MLKQLGHSTCHDRESFSTKDETWGRSANMSAINADDFDVIELHTYQSRSAWV